MTKYLILLIFSLSNYLSAFCLPGFDYQPIPGYYFGVLGGGSGGYEIDCHKVHTDLGYYVGAKLGTNIFSFLRVEGDAIWQENDVNHIVQTQSIQLRHLKGHVHLWSVMANALIDFNWDWPMRPFIGGGVGYGQAHGHWKGFRELTDANLMVIERRVKGSVNRNGFAWQIIAGLKFFIWPKFEANIEYRFFKLECVNNHKFGLALTRFF
jgi:OOP family OmpA-OmpF porin